MRIQTRRNAFTMIELLFVIVILGIVGGIALEAVRQYYDTIFRTQTYDKRAAEADHILEQLSKYFENAISSSIVNIDKNTIGEGTCKVPELTDLGDNYTVAFVAADSDSLQGMWDGTRFRPGWSEDVRLQDNNITASDANYTAAGTIIHALDPNSLADLTNSAIYDAGSTDVGACTRFNWNGLGTAGYHLIVGSNGTTLELNNANKAMDGKQKYLIRTAYAFKVDNNGDFRMYSNFRPWAGERYDTAVNRNENLLGQNVAHFYADYNAQDFSSEPNLNDRGMIWRLKVCMQGLDANLSNSDAPAQDICRERRVHVRY